MKDDQDGYTIRKWNPNKRDIPYGISTDVDIEMPGNLVLCFCCIAVDTGLNKLFEESVEIAKDGKHEFEDCFSEQRETVKKQGRCNRLTGVITVCIGLFFLFLPIINVIKMIPLVGALLSYIVAVAAGIFALIVGLTVALSTIAIAWLVYRPLYGVLMMTLVVIAVYLTFFFDW